VNEGDRRRAREEVVERVDARHVGSALGQRVLDDSETGTVLRELASYVIQLRVGKPAVVGDDQRSGRP
jgi:hypothetical protein